ncbi:MAG: DegQ family serine endoprotease [Gammaproteobacteria bacterium]|nr:MAG: DegQ family serine endoprotease [Gammaproteobacteria bacterium]
MLIKFILIFGILVSSVPGQASLPPLTDDNGKPLTSLAPMLEKVNPGVVNISTYSKQEYNYNPLLNDPFFRRFFNLPDPDQLQQPAPRKRQQSAGSGVVVDAEKGIVITNYHVIKGADEVQVSLYDGRSYKATVLGKDPDMDIAVLKIKAKHLVAVRFADSDRLRVGDYVVAIGNPFGLGHTVTTGIVSALGRSGLGIEGYENFIQTDASINPGNSGGALVDFHGNLVGINTAIIAPSGGNVGIGFAIPSNMVRASMEQIIEYGEVKRGQIGVTIQDITPDLREAFDLENGQKGVLITKVLEDSPAENAGLKEGDIIVAVNEKPTRSAGQLRSQIGIKKVGDKVRIKILRNGESKTLVVKIGRATAQMAVNGSLHPLLEGAYFESNPKGDGVVVTKIQPNSQAAYSGLRLGDIILSANKQRVYNLESFKKALSRSKSSILLQIERNGGTFFIVIR